MPTYEYLCKKCDEVSEVLHGMEETIDRCPLCKSKKITRLISAPGGFAFKGGGFHATDYPNFPKTKRLDYK